MVSAFSRFIALVTDFFTSVITLDGVPIIAFVGSIVLILNYILYFLLLIIVL